MFPLATFFGLCSLFSLPIYPVFFYNSIFILFVFGVSLRDYFFLILASSAIGVSQRCKLLLLASQKQTIITHTHYQTIDVSSQTHLSISSSALWNRFVRHDHPFTNSYCTGFSWYMLLLLSIRTRFFL